MIEASITQAGWESKPIQVNANPQTIDDALNNLYAFSDERRGKCHNSGMSNTISITSMPRMRKCFGWLNLSGATLHELPYRLRAPSVRVSKIDRSISRDTEYIALVYEYMEEQPNDPATVEEVVRFLWLAGFSHTMSPGARNWKDGVLVDFADVVHPDGYNWRKQLYKPWKADFLLAE